MPRFIISQEDIRSASKAAHHPVIALIRLQTEYLKDHDSELSKLKDPSAQQLYVERKFDGIATDIEMCSYFRDDAAFGPLEMVSIWSALTRILVNKYSRYGMARIMACAYSIGEIDDYRWKGFPKYWIKNCKIPEECKKDDSGLRKVERRLGIIEENLMDLYRAISGVDQDVETKTDIVKRALRGDGEATKRLVEIEKTESECPIIHTILENFGNGLPPIITRVGNALDPLGE